ncbi:MAG TPA: 2-oxoglutarate dehydrogenase complex dihydrolipoyllysine-residue succinyltransferase [Pirellulaceae bacterium]|nr:2-oxoglutarate dehydrogenase complex dihydrolipoyllysine-residue succinyltransferase [Pirellulaceae bacterium]
MKIPALGESIQEVQIGRWLKREGEAVAEDENVVELETDKASMELPAPAAGILAKILKHEGDSVTIGQAIAVFEQDGHSAEKQQPKKGEEPAAKKAPAAEAPKTPGGESADAAPKSRRKPAEPPPASRDQQASPAVTPSARRALREAGIPAAEVAATGNQLRREDVQRHIKQRQQPEAASGPKQTEDQPQPEAASDLEESVPMSLIRRRIAQRLVAAQQQAALLTTFNEIDMSAVIELRRHHREQFQDRYGIKLGFMSFFVKGVIDALKQFPTVNAEIRGTNIVYRNYHHIGIAIGAERGLVVPVLRHAQRMSFAEVEQAIDDFAQRAQENKLKPDELEGGTFTITNGGIYGSLFSTPIVNPPQSAVLGMHAIQERPVAHNGQVVIRPMMYVALTYDHRLLDGRDAASFLRRVTEAIEEPMRMLIET